MATNLTKYPPWILAAVMGIEGDLSDRRVLRHAWESIDEDTKAEIRTAWANTILDMAPRYRSTVRGANKSKARKSP